MKRKLIIGALVLAAGAVAAVPSLNADRYRGRIHQALEKALGRRVEIAGEVNYGIWNGPGFSISNVVIHEHPSVGIEPFAYVSELNATLSLTAMLQGKWELSSIVLDEPRVNLVKQESGSWNIRQLFRQQGTDLAAGIPEIRIKDGRVNLKFGDTKNALYFTNANFSISPNSATEMQMRFSMEPARTDRLAQGFGTLSGRGKYRWYADKPSEMDLDLELERSALSEAMTLVAGSGGSMRGFLVSRAKVQGSLNALKIEGSLRLEDVQRWDLLRAGYGSWPIRYRGTLDFPAGELDLTTVSEGDAAAPWKLRMRAHSLLDNPSWGAVASFHQMPMTALRDLLLYMNVSLPDRVALDGKLNGVLGYSRDHGLQGVVEMQDASVKAAGNTFPLLGARFSVDGEAFRLKPAELDLGEGRTAQVEGSYSLSESSYTWRTGTQMMPVKASLAAQKLLLGSLDIPVFEYLEEGLWQGTLQYLRSGEESHWNGAFTLKEAKLVVPGLDAPVLVESARGSIVSTRITLDSLRGSVGDIDFEASYRQEAKGMHPQRLKLTVAKADVADLEAILMPSLRRSGGILSRFRTPPLPAWMRERHLQAQVEVRALYSGDNWLGRVRGDLIWDGAAAEVRDGLWEREDASGEGSLSLRLAKSEPEYRFTGTVQDLPWKGGLIDGDLSLETNGTGTALLRNAKSTGKFTGRGLSLAPEYDYQNVSGNYEFSIARGTPSLKLAMVEAVSGGETFTGQGLTEEGKLNVELTSGKQKVRMSGTLWPLQLEPSRKQ